VIFIDSLSKTYGMPGWRVGFMAGPEVGQGHRHAMNSNHITNIPEIVTAAAIAALTGPQDVPVAEERRVPGQARPGDGGDGSDPGVVCPRPQGAFYVFPDISCAFGKTHAPERHEDRNDVDFCNALAGSQGRGLRAGFRLRRTARAAHQLHLPDAATAPGSEAHPGIFRRIDLPPSERVAKSPGAAGQIGYRCCCFRIASAKCWARTSR
jgi:aspartate aminotransferase